MMAWFYAALFIVGNAALIIGVGLLLAVHVKLRSIERMIAEMATRTPRVHATEPAVFRRAHDGEVTKVRLPGQIIRRPQR